MLTIPGVQLTVAGPKFLRALDQGAREWATGRASAGELNWRQLRGALISLDVDDAARFAGWLEIAGYVARIGPFDPRAPEGADANWKPEYISGAIALWLRHRRDVAAWLMGIPQRRFQDAITVARTFHGRLVLEPDQRKKFIRRLEAPSMLDARTLQAFLVGAGNAPSLNASFQWGPVGRPSATIFADSPMEAVALSIHIDRNFSDRQWISCARCGTGFERERGTERFCGAACRNYAITNARRDKIRLLTQADEAWSALRPKDRQGIDRWDWIAKRASRKGATIEAGWAKKEIGKTKSKTGGK